MEDHPRSRGEHCGERVEDCQRIGSSPLTRGALNDEVQQLRRDRIIPAHAGSTTPTTFPTATTPDHPRSRGEHPHQVHAVASVDGSSPLTRGALEHGQLPVPPARIIPAHAGSTHPASRNRPHPADHPRSRGEHPGSKLVVRFPRGSSPLTRGALASAADVRRSIGIIPAHAGSTWWVLSRLYCHWDHPRSRGEHLVVTCIRRIQLGSSPLTRGAQSSVPLSLYREGIIPAHAGSTRFLRPEA